MAVSTKTRGKGQNANKMTPEIYFARRLASNEKKIRDKSLKKLRRWITAKSAVPDAFGEDELMKLWKGLFYCMWMSDKPLIQEDLAETISGLVHCIVDRKLGLKFVSIALNTMAKSWSGLDTWRMDKFLMFVRRIIRHSLEYLAQGGWDDEEIGIYSQMLSDNIMNANPSSAMLQIPVGIQLHVANLFPEELAKAGGEELASSTILKMLEPFAKCLATSNDYRLKKDVFEHVFTYLIKQSDEALEYEAKGIEKAAIVSMSDVKNNRKKGRHSKKVVEADVEEEEKENQDESVEEQVNEDASDQDDDDDGDDNMEMEESNYDWGAKDPRAGGVDSVIPQIRPNYSELADMLFQMASEKTVRSKNRKAMYDLVKKFRDLSNGIYPLAVDLPTVGPGLTPRYMKSAAKQFIRDELAMSEIRQAEKLELSKSRKSRNSKDAVDVEDLLMEGVNEEDFIKEVKKGKQGNDFADLEGDSDSDALGEEAEDEGTDEDDDDDIDDEDDEMEDEDDDEDVDSSDEDLTDEGVLASEEDEEEEEIKVPAVKVKAKATKQSRKGVSKPAGKIATFEVEDNWEEEEVEEKGASQATMQKLKQKLKADKRPKNSGWNESPLKGEVEIVIPNKKFKGSDKLQPAQMPATPENAKDSPSNNSRSRRVNFVLNKNTAQEPKDYQESIRKSPGVPHDPDRQPSGGGVLKRNDSDSSKLASPSTRKPQRGGRSVRTSRT